MGETEYHQFREGQIVHIVTQRVDVGPGWVQEMDNYFGMEAKIVNVFESGELFELDIDGGQFRWCPEMFQEYIGYILEKPILENPMPDDTIIDSVVHSILGGFVIGAKSICERWKK